MIGELFLSRGTNFATVTGLWKKRNRAQMLFAVITENDESEWNDEAGRKYHFPKRYAQHLPPGTRVVYYKGTIKNRRYADRRLTGKPHYFGFATVGTVFPDEESSKGDLFANIESYQPLRKPVLAKQPNGYIEQIPEKRVTNYWRDGVRRISEETYRGIRALAGLERFFEIATTEEAAPDRFVEGSTQRVAVNAYERSSRAREACIEHYGYDCAVCGLNFEKEYGPLGKEFIHVHHLVDLAVVGEQYEVDPIEDLRPVCPNCHAILHRERPAISISRLARIVAQKKS